MKGNYRKATEEYIDLLLEVRQSEKYMSLADGQPPTYLAEKTGIELYASEENLTLKKVCLQF